MVSLDHAVFPDSPPASPNDSMILVSNASKPSHLRQIMSIRASMDKPLPPEPPSDTCMGIEVSNVTSTSNRSFPPPIVLPESIVKSLPVSPQSSKRHVTSPSLKSYADEIFKFTQSRLTSTIPQLKVDSPGCYNTYFSESQGPASVVSPQTSFRPPLQSRFSDWSVTTGSNCVSRHDSLAHTPVELDSSLMSPESFFRGFEETPTRKEFDFNRLSNISLASSETYELPSTLPPATPPSRAPMSDQMEEVSYFTNFDKYLDRDTSREDWPLPETNPPENVYINLSPIETAKSPEIQSVIRQRTNTVIRHTTRSTPFVATNDSPCAAYASPSTPIQIADVAVRVPHWLIGAIG